MEKFPPAQNRKEKAKSEKPSEMNYFERKINEVTLKIHEMMNEQFDSINETENEIWENYLAKRIDLVINDFLRLGDEQIRLNILGLMLEKRRNKDVEQFLSALLTEAGAQFKKTEGIVVASKSAARKEFFNKILDSDFTVKRYPTLETNPTYYTDLSTITKSKAISKILAFFSEDQDRLPGQTIVASETTLSANGILLGPFEADRDNFDEIMKAKAARQLQSLLGKPQTIHSSLAVFDTDSGKFRLSNDKTNIRFKEASRESDELIREYVNLPADTGGPIGKAGGYGLQDPQILKLVEEINGDPYTVIGFPLEQLAEMLKQLNINIAVEHDWDKIYEKTWKDPESVKLAKEKIKPNKWGPRSEKQFESLDFDEIGSLIDENIGSDSLSIVELAANVGYFADRFAQALIDKGFSVENVMYTDVEVRHDIRIKEIDINNLGSEHPKAFNIILINNPPGPNMINWNQAFESIRDSINGKGIVFWMSGLHKDDRYGIKNRIKNLGPKSKVLKLTENFAVLLITN